jgi:excisionase family DNA binding protein
VLDISTAPTYSTRANPDSSRPECLQPRLGGRTELLKKSRWFTTSDCENGCGKGIPKWRFNVESESLAPISGVIESICAVADETRNRRFLTADEASVFLGGLNTRTVTRWAREGYLPAYPIGEGKRRLWRFLESDLEDWMLSRRTGHATIDIEACADTLSLATDAPTED